VGDARKLSEYFGENSIDAIATEPSLGPPLKKRPKYEDAKKTMSELKILYRDSVSEINKVLKPGKKAVIINPSVVSSNGSLSLNLREIAKQNNFRFCKSILDRRSHQLVSREINIFYKINGNNSNSCNS